MGCQVSGSGSSPPSIHTATPACFGITHPSNPMRTVFSGTEGGVTRLRTCLLLPRRFYPPE